MKTSKTKRRHGAGEEGTPGAPVHENNAFFFLFFLASHLIPADHICCSHLSNSTATHLVSLSSSCTPLLHVPITAQPSLIHWSQQSRQPPPSLKSTPWGGFFSVLLRADDPSITKSSRRLNYPVSAAVINMLCLCYASIAMLTC